MLYQLIGSYCRIIRIRLILKQKFSIRYHKRHRSKLPFSIPVVSKSERWSTVKSRQGTIEQAVARLQQAVADQPGSLHQQDDLTVIAIAAGCPADDDLTNPAITATPAAVSNS